MVLAHSPYIAIAIDILLFFAFDTPSPPRHARPVVERRILPRVGLGDALPPRAAHPAPQGLLFVKPTALPAALLPSGAPNGALDTRLAEAVAQEARIALVPELEEEGWIPQVRGPTGGRPGRAGVQQAVPRVCVCVCGGGGDGRGVERSKYTWACMGGVICPTLQQESRGL